MDKILGALSLCRKAGKLVGGMDETENAIKSNKATTIFICNDVSERSKKKADGIGNTVPIGRNMEDLSPIFGKNTGIFTVTDERFLRLILKTIEEQSV